MIQNVQSRNRKHDATEEQIHLPSFSVGVCVAVVADAADQYVKQVEPQMGVVGKNYVFPQPLLLNHAGLWWRTANRHGNDKLPRKGGGGARLSCDEC